MAKLKPEDLDRIARQMKGVMNLRQGAGRVRITVHMGTCGIAAGARTVLNTLREEIGRRNLSDVLLLVADCGGMCSREPTLTIQAEGGPRVTYVDVNPERARQIVERHVVDGEVLQEYALADDHPPAGRG